MAKRYLLVLALAAGIATGAFAQSPFSVGGGLIFETGSLGSGEGSVSVPGPGGVWSTTWGTASLHQTGFGAWAFADATFAELSVAIMRGSHTVDLPSGSESSGSVTILDATLLGKLPIFLGWGDIFPLLGVGYQHYITQQLDISRYFAFSIMFGAGGDIDLTRQMFVRASILGSYRFANWTYGQWPRRAVTYDDGFGFGVTVKAGIGFRL